MEDIPTQQEINVAVAQLLKNFGSLERVGIVISDLYQNLVCKSRQMKNEQVTIQKKQPKVLPNKALAEQEDQQITLKVTPFSSCSGRQMQFLLRYEKRIVAQTFIKSGYSLQDCKIQIQRQGVLFQMTEKRYETITRAFVSQAYKRLEKFLQGIGIKIIKAKKKQVLVLNELLLKFRRYYNQEQQIVFLNFISLLYGQQQIDRVKISKKAAINFYERSRGLLQNGRGLSPSETSQTSNKLQENDPIKRSP